MDQGLRAEIQEFQAREIELLQSRQYEQWLNLFTSDLRYFMPIVSVLEKAGEEGSDGPVGKLAYFDDTLETLRLRVQRTDSRFAWTEIPPSRVRYFTQILRIEGSSASGEAVVNCNLIVYQTRLERDETFFVGERVDNLRRVNGDWRISSRKIVIDRSVVPGKNLSIFF